MERFLFDILKQSNYEKTDIIEKFIEAMSLKEYSSAYEMLQEDNWSKMARKHPNNYYLYLYKRLLFKMNSIFAAYECRKSGDYVELLKWLEQEIQKDNCDYVLLNELWWKKILDGNFNDELIVEINTFLGMVSCLPKIDSQSLENLKNKFNYKILAKN